MPNDWNIDIAGQVGKQGPTGLAGGPLADAPSDNTTYGRINATWGRVVNVAGDTIIGTLKSTANPNCFATSSATMGTSWYAINITNDGAGNWRYMNNGPGSLIGQAAGGGLNFYSAPSGTAGAVATLGSPINFDGAGNLNVAGSIVVSGNTTLQNVWVNGAFETNITMVSNLQVNGAINSTAVTTNNCTINTGLTVGQLNCTENGGNGSCQCVSGFRYNYWGGANNVIGFSYNNVVAGLVTVSVDSGGLSYALASAGSDQRAKSDIAPSTFDCLSLVKVLKLYEYRWMDQKDLAAPTLKDDAILNPVGFIAQELHQQAEWAVSPGNDTKPPFGPENPMITWSLQQNNLIALLTGSIQQLSAQVEMLRAELTELRGR